MILPLLLFLLVIATSHGDEPQIKLDLPRSSAAPNAGQATVRIITVTADEKVYLDKKEVSPDDLGKLLKEKKAADPGAKFALKASRKASFQSVSKVMDAAKSAGIDSLPTSTAERDGSPASP